MSIKTSAVIHILISAGFITLIALSPGGWPIWRIGLLGLWIAGFAINVLALLLSQRRKKADP